MTPNVGPKGMRSIGVMCSWLDPSIEPISHPIRAWVPLGKAQRLDRQAYESPALPLSYSAVLSKLIESDPERQPDPQPVSRRDACT